MRVAVFVDDEPTTVECYNLPPDAAARVYTEDLDHEDLDTVLIVVPIDDEAMALPGWTSSAIDPKVMRFTAKPNVTVSWTVDRLAPTA